MDNTYTTSGRWTIAEKLLFRFFFLFFMLLIIIENNGAFPLFNYVGMLLEAPLHSFVPWLSKHVLHLPYDITVFTNGSGDTTYDYVILLCILSVSLMGCLVWSVIDRRTPQYTKLYYWLTVALRFYVGCMLVNYGLVKIFKCQFPAPGLYRLTETYGESSPMGLAWTFLGFSKGYNFFMGIAEFAAILLLFRRTMTAGLLITLMTTSNVMAVNYFYDVPVKIISTMLVLMTLFLLARDAKRLCIFFFTGKAVSLSVIETPHIRQNWLRLLKLLIKILLISCVVLVGAWHSMEMQKIYGDNAPKPKLYGIYNVEKMYRADSTKIFAEAEKWKQLIVESEYTIRVKRNDNSVSRYFVETVETGKSINMMNNKQNDSCFFQYNLTADGTLLFDGIINRKPVSIRMKKDNVAENNFDLINTGFHWINEYPNNK